MSEGATQTKVTRRRGRASFLTLLSATLLFGYGHSSAQETIESFRLEKSQTSGFLTIRSRHPGLAVLIDDRLIGTTPLVQVPVDSGLHPIIVRNPNRADWLAEDWQQSVRVAPGQSYECFARFRVNYTIASEPFDAEVICNDQIIGKTPMNLAVEETDTVEVVLRKNGYQPLSLLIGRAPTRYLKVTLNPLPDFNIPQVLQKKNQAQRKRLTTRLTYASFGLAITSGLAAVYFKQKANETYDSYLVAGNPADMDARFRETKRFDRLSGISYATFEVNLLLSFYFFLKSRAK